MPLRTSSLLAIKVYGCFVLWKLSSVVVMEQLEVLLVQVSSGKLLLECWNCGVGLIVMVMAGWMCVGHGFADDSAGSDLLCFYACFGNVISY